MHIAKYKYDINYFQGFPSYLSQLYNQSLNEYLSDVGKQATQLEKQKKSSQIHNFIEYLEDYVVGLTKLGFITKSNINDVLTEITKIKSISVLPKKLRGIEKSSSTPNDEIISSLAKRSFDKNFINDIISEYQESQTLEQDLFITLVCLGRIKDTSYALFGGSKFLNSSLLSQQYFENLKYLCDKNEDYQSKVVKK